ncbi:hypothetical protein [Actinoplanes lobatus]|uniref:Uncharacterized protein n=1 Tax=Actinoplanes lobatus TaxID=113568 RepID=A0A7W7HKB7_9ACTN|nr:hypothetical protein [Actinoplanes lobatus]MBB4752138.1 hypothetical protein [Actinoplanes lobatus]
MRRTIDLVTSSFAGRFTHVEPRRASAGFVTGLPADLPKGPHQPEEFVCQLPKSSG